MGVLLFIISLEVFGCPTFYPQDLAPILERLGIDIWVLLFILLFISLYLGVLLFISLNYRNSLIIYEFSTLSPQGFMLRPTFYTTFSYPIS